VVHLVIPAEQVKNDVTIEAQLQSQVVKLLELYLDRYRPLLLSGASSSLFPNTSGRPKSRHTLAQQIKKFVRRECGLQVNMHLFRHFGAAHYLSDHPGDYGTMRLVLGHTSFDSTTRAYCGTETVAAMRQFDEHVLRLRAQLTSDCTPKACRRSRRAVNNPRSREER
jgi:site-specific recombinase XerD